MKPSESPFGRLIQPYAKKVGLWGFYVANARFLNYAFACGVIGVLVNYIVYHLAAGFVWEPAAFYFAVVVAALSNYTFTVGPLGHIFGLSKEEP